jgi:hypothetical protein
MAAIDKIYSTQILFKEYILFLNWCENEGNDLFHKHCSYGIPPYDTDLYECKRYQLKDFIYLYDEQTYMQEVPICNLPEAINIFLIRYLPKSFEGLHKALKEMYGDDLYVSILNKTSIFDTPLKRSNTGNMKFIKNTFIHNYICKLQQPLFISINYKEGDNNLWYNKITDEWFDDKELKPIHSNNAKVTITSLKALVRKIKKWNLPDNVLINIDTKYKGSEALIKYTHK